MTDRMRRLYFPVTSLILLVLTLIGFSDNLFTDVGQPSNFDPKFIIHGLLCGAWIILLVIQSLLASTHHLALHRKLGIAGMLIAIGVTLSTIWVFVAIWQGWDALNEEAKANRVLLPSYSLFIALAYLNRRRPDWHKRLILVGTFFMLGPVLGRAYDPLLVPIEMTPIGKGLTEAQIESAFLPFFFGVWLAFFASLFVYDLRVTHRIHPVTAVGPVWFGTACAIALML